MAVLGNFNQLCDPMTAEVLAGEKRVVNDGAKVQGTLGGAVVVR